MNRKSRATTPMNLRSGCRGDCGSYSGNKKTDHHHHHHHHHHFETEQKKSEQITSLTSRSGSKSSKRPLTRDKSPYQNKRIVKASSTPSKNERSLNTSSETIVNDCSVQLSPILESKLVPDLLLGTKQINFTTTTEKRETVSHIISSAKSMKTPETHLENIHNFALMPSDVIKSFTRETKTVSVEKSLPKSPLFKGYSSGWTDSQISSYTKQGTRPHYSDYSSGEELELNDTGKTDYTYAWSASYNMETGYPQKVPSPNMSRRALHSSGNSLITNSYQSLENNLKVYNPSEVDRSYDKLVVEQSLHDVAQSVASQTFASRLHSQRTRSYNDDNLKNSYYSQTSLSYGLDSESDDEEFLLKSHRINSQTKDIIFQNQSFISLLCNIGECVFPVQTLWHKTWSLIYWILCSILLWDSWILSRGIFKQKWLYLLLLLLPFLLGGIINHQEISEILPAVSSSLMQWGSLLIIPFTKAEHKEEDQTIHNSSQFASLSDINFQKLLINLQDMQKAQVSRPEVEAIVRSVIRDELVSLSASLNSQKKLGAEQAESLTKHDSQLFTLRTEMQAILSRTENLGQELKNAKEKIIEKQQTDHGNSIRKLNDLEMEMDSLKDNIHQVHETQALLLANMRNCCRNNTLDPALIENQIALALLQIMGKGPKSSNVRSEFVTFLDWMKSSFVGPTDLHTGLNLTAEKVTQEINQDIVNRVEIMAKNMATAAFKASLQQQQQEQKKLHKNISVDVGLNENEVRQIVRDAIMLYDADKTGQPDFALETGGGSVISTRCSETYQSRTAELSLFGIPLWFQSYSPRTVIQPGVNPGECWAFKGSEGYLVIQLSGWIRPSAFSLEHVPRSLATNNLDSAPKDFSVYGLKNEKEMDGILLGKYIYDIESDPLQYFLVADPGVEAFPIVELRVHSNHGNVDYTCLYRFRVHGELVKH